MVEEEIRHIVIIQKIMMIKIIKKEIEIIQIEMIIEIEIKVIMMIEENKEINQIKIEVKVHYMIVM